MKNNVLFISEKTIKETTIIGANVESNYIECAIMDAQIIGLQALIGTYLYDTLSQMVANNSLTQEYKTLLDEYVIPYLKHKTCVELLVALSFKFRNEGIVNTNSENVNQTSLSDIKYLKAYYDDKATFCANRLSEYLCANKSKFPEYCKYRDSSDMKSNKKAYNTNVFLF